MIDNGRLALRPALVLSGGADVSRYNGRGILGEGRHARAGLQQRYVLGVSARSFWSLGTVQCVTGSGGHDGELPLSAPLQ